MIDFDYEADKVLDALLCYVTRPDWRKKDRQVIVGILQEWETEVTNLEARLAHTETRLSDLQANASKVVGYTYEFTS